MSCKKKHTAGGVITFHTPLPVSLLKSEEHMADMEDTTLRGMSPSQPSGRRRSSTKCGGAGKKDGASPSGTQPSDRQDCVSHTSIRRLQAEMEAENQQVKEIIQPLLDAENGFVKELERFLSQRDVAELQRRELLHKRWTERVWFPLQKRVEAHVCSCSPMEARRRQRLYSQYLHHCNTKGFVFLESYDPTEYNPFLLYIKKTNHFKHSAPDLKEPSYLQLHDRLKENRTVHSCEAGCKHSLPQSNHPLTVGQASSNYQVSACGKTPARDQPEGRRSSRLDTIPYHISSTATPDGRCHQSGCLLSRCGGRQQAARLHQPLPTTK